MSALVYSGRFETVLCYAGEDGGVLLMRISQGRMLAARVKTDAEVQKIIEAVSGREYDRLRLTIEHQVVLSWDVVPLTEAAPSPKVPQKPLSERLAKWARMYGSTPVLDEAVHALASYEARDMGREP